MSSLAHQVIFQFRFLLPLRKNKEGDGALVYNSNKTKRYKDISLKKKVHLHRLPKKQDVLYIIANI